MPSSTSSSEAATLRDAASAVARASARPVVVAALLVAGLALVARARPAPRVARDLEGIIVAVQRQRAAEIGDVDVLIVGDSSALMGVDAAALGAALGGRRVESLATIGYVGPAGFGHLLEAHAAGGRRAGAVVFMMHGTSLGLPEAIFARRGFEAALFGRETRDGGLRRVRDVTYDRLLAPLLDLPLPGAFGRFYGRPEELAAALRRGHGTLVDPNAHASGEREPLDLELSPAVAVRLDAFRAAATRAGVGELHVAVAPLPDRLVGPATLAGRQAVLDEMLRRLAPAAALELPASLPEESFATATHLSAAGRAKYTALLAAALRAR